MIHDFIIVGDRLYRALNTKTCTCRYNVPYDGGAVARKLTEQCSRCAALDSWKALVGDPNEVGRDPGQVSPNEPC